MNTIYHKHHIIPRHAGGTDDPSNIVELTIEEHAEAHRVLYEKYGRWQDNLAWQGLVGMIGKEEIIRKSNSEGGKKGGGSEKGRKFSEEAKGNMRKSRLGKRHSQKTKEKMSLSQSGENHPFYGKLHSEESKSKMSKSKRGKKLSEEHRLKISLGMRKRTQEST